MARARGSGVPLLVDREEIARAANRAATGQGANAEGRKAPQRAAGSPRRRRWSGLPHTARYMCPRPRDVWFFPPIGAGSPAGKANNVIGVVGPGVGNSAIIVTGGGVAAVGDRVRMDVLRRGNRENVLGGAW